MLADWIARRLIGPAVRAAEFPDAKDLSILVGDAFRLPRWPRKLPAAPPVPRRGRGGRPSRAPSGGRREAKNLTRDNVLRAVL